MARDCVRLHAALSKYRVPRWLTEGIPPTRNIAGSRPGPRADAEFAHQLSAGKTFGVKTAWRLQAAGEPGSGLLRAVALVEHLVALNGDSGRDALAYAGVRRCRRVREGVRRCDDVEASFKTSSTSGMARPAGRWPRPLPRCARRSGRSPGVRPRRQATAPLQLKPSTLQDGDPRARRPRSNRPRSSRRRRRATQVRTHCSRKSPRRRRRGPRAASPQPWCPTTKRRRAAAGILASDPKRSRT